LLLNEIWRDLRRWVYPRKIPHQFNSRILLASEFDPLPPNALVDQAPFTAWQRRGIGHEHVELLPRLYQPRGRLGLIRRQSRRNFGRPCALIERSFR